MTVQEREPPRQPPHAAASHATTLPHMCRRIQPFICTQWAGGHTFNSPPTPSPPPQHSNLSIATAACIAPAACIASACELRMRVNGEPRPSKVVTLSQVPVIRQTTNIAHHNAKLSRKPTCLFWRPFGGEIDDDGGCPALHKRQGVIACVRVLLDVFGNKN